MQKLRRRIDMLNKSTTWPEADKVEIRKGLKRCCMSPEQSVEEEDDGSDDSESDEDERHTGKSKVIRVRPLSWRSDRFTNILKSLDRKYLRKISERARSMIQTRKEGETLEGDAPVDAPAWMVKA